VSFEWDSPRASDATEYHKPQLASSYYLKPAPERYRWRVASQEEEETRVADPRYDPVKQVKLSSKIVRKPYTRDHISKSNCTQLTLFIILFSCEASALPRSLVGGSQSFQQKIEKRFQVGQTPGF
jgi:hypothetical protein